MGRAAFAGPPLHGDRRAASAPRLHPERDVQEEAVNWVQLWIGAGLLISISDLDRRQSLIEALAGFEKKRAKQ